MGKGKIDSRFSLAMRTPFISFLVSFNLSTEMN